MSATILTVTATIIDKALLLLVNFGRILAGIDQLGRISATVYQTSGSIC